ncbi:hypothetical protein CHLNCDRAFT_58003 [Chlorella variabilis]|uniref:F-box domain-containing protein n=1 Tax=Chlorella variabilis TaxID=554065 RepID=E1ZG69_CHLVA|nr:hypothetical protein CHLNCDRAFT_58003 [Chlorella variabilis]EFN55415.1 hypothetical protein CHLNCDRAFT_58003 [Chlorella variabilis]|eukprot:XP_005847517.1 hypothetical protein CHLNCDRAFT_58003 [Chlorella variabilis]
MAAVAAAASDPALGSSAASPGGEGASPRQDAACRRRAGPAAWLRRALRGAQAVAEERPVAQAPDDDDEVDDASYDGGAAEPLDDFSFGSLPEHLLEKVFSHLRGTNRRHHFAICGVNRQWRRLGQAMFFSRPWEVAHLICHPTQLFCLSPRNVTGSRSGLLKCFVRREHGPSGKRFTFHIGKDASQPQRSRFLMAAKQGGRDETHLFLNSRCEGPPCARLRCNMFATQASPGSPAARHCSAYKLTLAEDLQLEPTGTSRSRCQAAAAAEAGAAARRGAPCRLSSWGEEAAAEAAAAVAAAAVAAQRRHAPQEGLPRPDQLGVDCFADLQYQARVKGFMQPRRMRVLLPHPSLLFYDQQLPQLSRRFSELELRPATPPTGACAGAGGALAPSGSASARRASQSPSSSRAGSADGSPQPPPALGGGEEPAAAPAAGRLGRLLSLGRRGGGRQQLGRLLRQHKTVPADEGLQPVVLQNKAPHWNEGLRCWCLNFRGRVKLASVKNFQLVRGDDPGERVVMQFGKAEQDAFILDFNPTVLTAVEAFGVVLSTFDSKLFL